MLTQSLTYLSLKSKLGYSDFKVLIASPWLAFLMDNQIQLDQLLNHPELRSILEALLRSLKTSLRIKDLERNLLLGEPTQTPFPEYPVTAAQQTIGWTEGEEPAQIVAQLLTYLANQELLVIFDDLTKIANRRYFNRYLQQEWRRSLRENLPLSLLLCDLDYFKFYNDYYGHQLGDNCLRQVAQALSEVLQRPSDLVARYGGEEFIILLPNTDNQGAETIAEKLCLAIQQLQIPHRCSEVNPYVTISIGVATIVPILEATVNNLVTMADLALYRAKASGRNRYCLQNNFPSQF